MLGKPVPGNDKLAYYVMVTAAHVLNGIQGDQATLLVRTKQGDTFQKVAHSIKIRDGQRPLWTTHPSADVAVMYVSLPDGIDIRLATTDLLATDDMLRKFELHAGDRLACLGYPLGLEANESGFPILRSGYIASFPLLPTASVKSFLFDFNVFEGNSGGPVYFVESNRAYGGSINIGTVHFIVGLVSEQRVMQEQVKSLNELRTQTYRLGLAVVIHAAIIREALALLPADPKVARPPNPGLQPTAPVAIMRRRG